MTTIRHMRASDEDRERVVDFLRDAHVVGRLSPREFYERLDAAYAAATWGELDDLIADLPMVWTDASAPSSWAALAGRSLSADGWKSQAETRRGKRPTRRYYELTDKGKAALGGVLAEACQDARFKPLMVPHVAGGPS